MNERQTNPRKPHLVVIAGPNGSGKTTVMRRMVDLSWFPGACVIDPDAVAAALPGGFRETGNAARAALAAGRHRYHALAARQDILWETVFAARGDAMRFVRAAKSAGYFAHLLFIATRDPAINAYRVARRYMEGGHPIPVDVIVDRYYRSMGNLSRSLGDFDLAHILDNSVDDRAPALQCVMDNGGPRLWLAHPAEHWVCMAADTQAITPDRLRSDTLVLPPYLSAGS